MKRYKVRVHELGWRGFITQADHYEDFQMESEESLGELARRLAQEGFEAESGKWIMPGAIMWIEASR
jgi:hypothetical protein